MSGLSCKVPGFTLTALLCAFGTGFASSEQISSPPVPPNFSVDRVFAAKLRVQLLPHTEPATGRQAVAKEVMGRLLKQLPASDSHFTWELRIAKDAGNVFSSPDGTIYVDKGLAEILGSQSGLWAAALSHEIAHIARRDWARRYLFQKSLEEGGAAQITLGAAGGYSGSWMDPRTVSKLLAGFSQAMEIEADSEGLMLMARAGFHPNFVPALHHLLRSQSGQFDGAFADSTHPDWESRDERLRKMYLLAGKEYDRLWPDRYASPGGNPPVVVYARPLDVKRDASGGIEVAIPLHCENLAGSVEVVLRLTGAATQFPREVRQFTGCTSDHTLITFVVPESEFGAHRDHPQAEIAILDDNGEMLNRSLTSLPFR